MSLTRTIDIYCERTDPGFWSEPANALTNVAFVIAAALLWRAFVHRRTAGTPLTWDLLALPWLLGLIGVCSFLFHTLATVWAGLVDQLAILLFGCVFLYGFLRRIARARAWLSFMSAIGFSVVSFYTPRWLPAGFLNQSGAYFPYLALLLAMGVFLYARGMHAWRRFALAVGLFCVSLSLRTLDAAVCDAFPLGTHFLWHLINAALLFVLAQALVAAVTSARGS
jgi:hypothetical protein